MMNLVPAPVAGRRKKPEAVLEKMARDLSNIARDLFNMYRDLFIIYRVLFGLYRVLKIAERVLFKPGSALTTMERTRLRGKGSIQGQKTTVSVKPWYETAANRGG
jgi:hypothetical protein